MTYTPPSSPNVYMVVAGDTVETIAEKMIGDRYYAKQIVNQNGLLMKARLAPGQMIYLPPVMVNRVSASTVRPYHEFVSLLQGRLTPYLRLPKPKNDHKGMWVH